ncbi:MAG: hypothetical protein NT178_10950 [Proteobacteria bacterium]|nr:hypothetical protein [Pseudomonadota bacterium]
MTQEELQTEAIEPGQSFVIDTFRPEDAPGVARLFRAVYGNGYPVKLVYDPDQLINAFNTLENIPVVARTSKGDLAAYEALYRSCPNPLVYEAGQGLVLPAYRKNNIINKINQYVCEVIAPGMDIDAVFGEAVCNNVYMQKSWQVFANITTALEVDLMPAEAYAKELSASGRVACLLMFRNCRSRPQIVYVPPVYEDALKYIYTHMNDERTFNISIEEPGKGLSTEIKKQVFDFAKVARLTVHEAGDDFPAVFNEQTNDMPDQGIVVIQVWLKLSWPWVGSIVEYLRTRGYFLGGVLPGWFGTDGLLMQKIMGKPNWEGIQLYSEHAKKIMRIVKDDWSSQVIASIRG